MDLAVTAGLFAEAGTIATLVFALVALTKGLVSAHVQASEQGNVIRLESIVLGVGLALLFAAGLNELHTMRDALAASLFGFGIGTGTTYAVAGIKALPSAVSLSWPGTSPSDSPPAA